MHNGQTTKTILIADDDRFIITAFKAGLENAGYNVLTAGNGNEAITIAIAEYPDLVMLDLILPGKNGFEVLKALRADPATAATPVIVLTNLSQSSDEDEARRYGAADFLVKANVSLNDVQLRIDQLIGSAAGA